MADPIGRREGRSLARTGALGPLRGCGTEMPAAKGTWRPGRTRASCAAEILDSALLLARMCAQTFH